MLREFRLVWTAPLPAINLSLFNFLLIRAVGGGSGSPPGRNVFFSTGCFAQSGLDRSLQYAIAQVSATSCWSLAFFFVLENAGIHLAALAVFAARVGVGVGFGLQNIASNFISGLVILAERPITIGDRVEVAGILAQFGKSARGVR